MGVGRRGRAEGIRLSLLVVRHASAGNRDEWHDPDELRPLDERGMAQARHLPELLDGYAVTRLLSLLAGSDAVACLHGDLTLALFGRKGKKGAVWVVDESLQPLRVLQAT